MEKKIVTRLLIVINFIAIFIDPFTATLDLNTFRLLSFSVINTFSFIYIFTVPDLSKLLFKALKTKISILILCFISWGLLSSLYADNVNQVFLRSFSFFNFYFSFLILYVLIAFNKFKEYQIGYFMCLVVIAQLASSYNAFIQIINITQYNFSYNVFLNGFFPNRNITAAVYLYQLPFLIYILIISKSNLVKIISGLSCFSLVYMIFLMSARTSYVILTVLLIFYLLIFIISANKKTISFFGVFSITLVLSFVFSTYSLGLDNSAHAVNRINTIDFEEESTNTRLRYYQYGIEQIIKNPIFGVGLGNWKIESIERDKENIISYIIPYTMHNDFLEVGAELGVLGIVFYLSIFIFALIKLYRHFLKNKSDPYLMALISFFIVYIVDANINFPFIRASQQFYLALFLSLTLYIKNISYEDNN
jgi:O-antigen ligase